MASEQSFAKVGMDRRIVPDQYETFALDLKALEQIFKEGCPHAFQRSGQIQNPCFVHTNPRWQIPRLQLCRSARDAPDLAAKFPDIKTYAGWSEADPTAYMRFGIFPKGFHAMVLSAFL
ncbi:MAG: hypothetical protein R2825_03865 [Saprospiraceae bacterium]